MQLIHHYFESELHHRTKILHMSLVRIATNKCYVSGYSDSLARRASFVTYPDLHWASHCIAGLRTIQHNLSVSHLHFLSDHNGRYCRMLYAGEKLFSRSYLTEYCNAISSYS